MKAVHYFLLLTLFFTWGIPGDTLAQPGNNTADQQLLQMRYMILAEKSYPKAVVSFKPGWISRHNKEMETPVDRPHLTGGAALGLFFKTNSAYSKDQHSFTLSPIIYPQSNTFVQILETAGTIFASIYYPSYVGSIYHNNGAVINAYNYH